MSRVNRQPTNLLAYWEARARKHGKRAVLNLTHSESESESVTQWQKDILYPHFRAQIRGDEKLALDLGCGPGRFTADLAKMIHGRAVGIDPIGKLLQLAPPDPDVEYLLGDGIKIPQNSASMDVVWICLVLGGMADPSLNQIAMEVQRVLKPNGLLFLVENTSNTPNCAHWIYRSVEKYKSLFQEIELELMGNYKDCGEIISIMAGRKA